MELKLQKADDSSSHDLFVMQQILHKKLENRESLPYLTEKDDLRGHLYKYLLTVKGISDNLINFNELLAAEVKEEDELYG